MHALRPSAAARSLVEALCAPRRETFRRALLLAALEHDGSSAAAREATLARLHDLCVKELAERVRLAGRALHRAYLGESSVGTDRLFAEIRLEVDAFLRDELAAVACDERLAAAALDRLPAFLGDRLPPALFG